MVCQFCKQKEAKVHLTQIIENEVKKVDLCEGCARDKGVNDPAGFSLADLLLGLGAAQEMQQASEAKSPGNDTKCELCGFTQADFKKTGRMGCSDCYEVFADGLAGLLKTMHKGTTHRGKGPRSSKSSSTTADSGSSELSRLEKLLQTAITREDFEEAASLRDQIKSLRAASSPRP